MSISQSVSSHLPFLRRYARALTGSQVSGDKYVEAALNTLVNQPELIDRQNVRPGGNVPDLLQDLEFSRG